MKKIKPLFICICLTGVLFGQKSIPDTRTYLKNHLPPGWVMDNSIDSTLIFKKLVHWQYVIDPPPNSFGEDDTMSMYVFFHPYKTDSDLIQYQNILSTLAKEKEELKTHRHDSIYNGKNGFYNWIGKFEVLTWEEERYQFTNFKNCSITFGYFLFKDPLREYDDLINKEIDLIKETLINYLK